jgi:UrcA family protein
MKTPSITMVAATALMAAAQANAQPSPIIVQSDAPTATVSFADLDLTAAAGRQTLEGRAARAAAGLCLADPVRALDDVMAERQCFAFAMSHARIDIDLAVSRAKTQLAYEPMIRLAAR